MTPRDSAESGLHGHGRGTERRTEVRETKRCKCRLEENFRLYSDSGRTIRKKLREIGGCLILVEERFGKHCVKDVCTGPKSGEEVWCRLHRRTL